LHQVLPFREDVQEVDNGLSAGGGGAALSTGEKRAPKGQRRQGDTNQFFHGRHVYSFE
jgi:hypothetical protein